MREQGTPFNPKTSKREFSKALILKLSEIAHGDGHRSLRRRPSCTIARFVKLDDCLLERGWRNPDRAGVGFVVL
jgi:hypothetical protein